jgi:hypothetical protein
MCDAGAEGEFGWKLHEDWAELFAEPMTFLEESLQKRAAVYELCGVRDGLRNLDGKPEIRRRAGGPALPGFTHVGPVEAGVDFDAVENGRAALQVRSFGREGCRVLLWERPAGGANAEMLWMCHLSSS